MLLLLPGEEVCVPHGRQWGSLCLPSQEAKSASILNSFTKLVPQVCPKCPVYYLFPSSLAVQYIPPSARNFNEVIVIINSNYYNGVCPPHS